MTLARRLFLALAAPAALAATATPACAAGISATTIGQASATLIAPLSVTQIADLDFGVIVANRDSAGTVALAPDTTPAQFGGGAHAGCEPALGCPVAHAAQFAVTGEAGRNYTIAAPSSIAITGEAVAGGQAQTLTISAITLRSASRPANGASGQLDAAGRDSFWLGGTLGVPANLPAARYRVSLQVIVTYS